MILRRGRTTTGLVIATMIQLARRIAVDPPLWFVKGIETSRESIHFDIESEQAEKSRYRNGEYKIILQLLAVLANGKSSKRLVDRCINMW